MIIDIQRARHCSARAVRLQIRPPGQSWRQRQGRSGTGKDRVQVAEVGGSVSCSTAQVGPADLVLADGDGVVIVPRSRAEEIVDLAEAIEAGEAQIRAAVLDGLMLRQARSQHGYFELQRRGQ